MKLRELEYKDAPFMLEWMHDLYVVENLKKNFKTKTLQDCLDFIASSQSTDKNLHLAIVDSADVYMGTVSLKNITEMDAEFAIVIRKFAMGKGYSQYAMTEIIRIGFEKLKLNKIYWCVDSDNKRAIKFYDKNGYQRVKKFPKNCMCVSGWKDSQEQTSHYIWYQETI